MAKVCNRETYKVMSFMNNFCLNVKGGFLANNVGIIGYQYGNGNNEKWIAEVGEGGYFSLTTRQGGSGETRYVLDASESVAGTIEIWEYSGNDNQFWYAEPVANGSYLSFIKNKKFGTYLQYNGDNQLVTLVSKAPSNNNQKWSIQEVSIVVCQDGAWFDSLVWTNKVNAEKQRIETERIEKERIEKIRIERERIERERIEHERIEKEKSDAEILEKERIIRERELRIAELEKAELEKKNSIDAAKAKAERELAEKEKAMAEREHQLALLELEAREKTIRERELWIIERERLEKELREKLVIEHRYVTGVVDEENKLKQQAERERLEQEQRDHDRIERERIEIERIEREKREKIEIEKIRKEKELRELEIIDREAAIKERERWLLEREQTEKTKKVIVYHVIRGKDGKLYRVPDNASGTSTSTTTGGGTTQTSHTTHTVEQRGDERVTVDVTEIERVIKTVEYN